MTINEVTPEMLNKAVVTAILDTTDAQREELTDCFVQADQLREHVYPLVKLIFPSPPIHAQFVMSCSAILSALSIGVEIGLALAKSEREDQL